MLKDKDRIFTNLYGFESPFLDGAKKRGDWDGTKDILARGVDSIVGEMKESGVIQEKNLPESKVALVYGQMVRDVAPNHLWWEGGAV
jgi:hypothetical protein